MSLIKICGLKSEADVDAVNLYLPDFAGFIVNYEKSRRNISPEKLADLKKRLDSRIKAVAVTVDEPLESVRKIIKSGSADIAQLHGNENDDYIMSLKADGIEVWKAYVIKTAEDVKRALNSPADMVLLDAGRGNGTAFNWSLINNYGRNYILAGGLDAGNLEIAYKMLSPCVFDVSSGAETDGVKDPFKIKKLVELAHSF